MTATLIVVPCLNEEAHLRDLLDQLTRDNALDTIVVADGGSSDGSRAIVEELQRDAPGLILLDNPARLQSAGINLAVRQYGAGRTWLARIDAHCRYPRNYVRRLVDAAGRHGAASVVVPLVTVGKSCFQIAAATAQNNVIGTGGSPHRHLGKGRFVDHGHHALMAIDAFVRAGGYREDMAANEDAELDRRIAAQRAAIWLEPSLAIDYFPRSTMAGLVRQYYRYGQGRMRTLRLHRGRPRLRQLIPLAAPIALGLALGTPWAPVLAVPLMAWLGLTLGAGFALGIMARNRCACAAGLAAGAMHLAWGSGFIAELVSGRPRSKSVPRWDA